MVNKRSPRKIFNQRGAVRMIYVTGDCHADFTRFNTKIFPEQYEMTKDDYVIICGDFGGVWNRFEENKHEKHWMDWLEDRPFTTLFCEGNHENFDRLYSYPVEKWNGGNVHKIRPSVIHLMRGQIFQLCDRKFFVFGGAKSHDIDGGILDPEAPDFKKKKKDDAIEIKAYFEGTVLPLEKVNDPMFSDKLMGDGVAIEPDAGNLYAPVDGKVASIFDTKHAIGFVLDNGAEVLMHIGMDTVELNGEGFDLDVSVGDEVHAGELMGSIDLDFVKSKGKETVTPIVLTAMDEYKIEFVKTEGHVNIGDVLYKISK